MNGLDFLWLVQGLLPTAFFADLLILPFALWWIRRWRRARLARGVVLGICRCSYCERLRSR